MNRVHQLRSLWLALILALALGLLPLAAQDTGSGGAQGSERVSCDSTLILLAGLAQRYFGYTSLSGLDMAQFEYGQYGALYDMSAGVAPQASVGGSSTGNTAGDAAGSTGSPDTSNTIGGATGGDAQATQDSSGTTSSGGMGSSDTTGGTAGGDAQATQDAGTTGGGMSGAFLNPPALMDEDPLCMQLRAELEGFFATQLASPDWDTNFRGLAGGMGGSGAGSETGAGG